MNRGVDVGAAFAGPSIGNARLEVGAIVVDLVGLGFPSQGASSTPAIRKAGLTLTIFCFFPFIRTAVYQKPAFKLWLINILPDDGFCRHRGVDTDLPFLLSNATLPSSQMDRASMMLVGESLACCMPMKSSKLGSETSNETSIFSFS